MPEAMTEIDPVAVARFWHRAALAAGLDATSSLPEAWRFADTPALADELLAAVLDGRKTGTSTSVAELEADGESMPRAGDLSILVDAAGAPRALIRTTSVKLTTFGRVDEEFAATEGEDDLSLAAWRHGHESYFRRVLARHAVAPDSIDDLPIVAERFELVYS